jgi:hypothetical protein
MIAKCLKVLSTDHCEIQEESSSWVWWCVSVIPALGQEGHKFEVNLGYIMISRERERERWRLEREEEWKEEKREERKRKERKKKKKERKVRKEGREEGRKEGRKEEREEICSG